MFHHIFSVFYFRPSPSWQASYFRHESERSDQQSRVRKKTSPNCDLRSDMPLEATARVPPDNLCARARFHPHSKAYTTSVLQSGRCAEFASPRDSLVPITREAIVRGRCVLYCNARPVVERCGTRVHTRTLGAMRAGLQGRVKHI